MACRLQVAPALKPEDSTWMRLAASAPPDTTSSCSIQSRESKNNGEVAVVWLGSAQASSRSSETCRQVAERDPQLSCQASGKKQHQQSAYVIPSQHSPEVVQGIFSSL